MKLVIDTNRLAAALIKSSVTREIILSDKFDLYSPDYILTEIDKNRDFLIKKAKITKKEFEEILLTLLNHIHLIPFEEFESKLRFYLESTNKNKSIEIAERGYQHLLKFHTTEKRVKYMLSKLQEKL